MHQPALTLTKYGRIGKRTDVNNDILTLYCFAKRTEVYFYASNSLSKKSTLSTFHIDDEYALFLLSTKKGVPNDTCSICIVSLFLLEKIG